MGQAKSRRAGRGRHPAREASGFVVAALLAGLAASDLDCRPPTPVPCGGQPLEELADRGARLLAAGGAQAAREAAELFGCAAAEFRRRGEPAGEAESLYGRGVASGQVDDRQAAAEAYRLALALYRSLGDRRGEASACNNLGLLAFEEGDVAGAFLQLEAALSLRRAAGEAAAEAATRQNLAALHAALGEPQAALDAYREALAVARQVGELETAAAVLNNLGVLLTSLGRRGEAREALLEALALHRLQGDRRGEAGTLNNLGRLALRHDEPSAAVEHFRAARALFQSVGDRRGQADATDNLGLARLDLGAIDEAVGWIESALALRRALGDRRGEAASLSNLGQALSERGQWGAARALLAEARRRQQQLGNLWDESLTLLRLARSARARGSLDEALAAVESGIDLVESLRARLAHPEFRASFAAAQRDLYELRIDLLMELHRRQPERGFAALAFVAAERARARSLLEILGERRLELAGGLGRGPAEAAKALRPRIGALERRRSRLLEAGEEDEAGQLGSEVALLLERYRDLEAEIRAASPLYSALVAPEPAGLFAVGELLGPETLLLEIALGAERSYLWAVDGETLAAFTLPPRRSLEAAALELHELLAASHRRAFRAAAEVAAAELSLSVLGPVAERLAGRRLVVVPDGALAYVPFAALPRPGDPHRRPLGIDQEVVSLPSASVLVALRRAETARRLPSRALAVIADPVFEALDPRVGVGAGRAEPTRLPRLPFSRTEAARIAALVPPGEALLALDFAASRELVESGALAPYRFVHFATHARLDAQHPELSGIELSAVGPEGSTLDGTLRLLDVWRLELAADLVTLSACRTALGREVRGEGLVGLSQGFLHAGARAVLVSLWQVPDEATALWMARFYAILLGEGARPSDALRRTRAAMWADPRWSAPSYWSAFELQGDAW